MPAQDGGGSVDRLLDELVALERSALDRWIRLDPQGYLDLQAPEVTYFDPFTERRVDGLDAMQVRLAPMKKMKAPFTDPLKRRRHSTSNPQESILDLSIWAPLVRRPDRGWIRPVSTVAKPRSR